MPNGVRSFSATRRCASIALSVLLLIFVVAIQPHRVHHFFTVLNPIHPQMLVAEDDCEHQHDQNVPAQTSCVIQSAAQNSHLGQIQLTEIPFTESTFETMNSNLTQFIQYFSVHSFFQRAPPSDMFVS